LNPILAAWNEADKAAAMAAMLVCCGSQRWAAEMVDLRPIGSPQALGEMADRIWSTMQEPDLLEAFACHPRIGARNAGNAGGPAAAWSNQEQSRTKVASEEVLLELEERNRLYEEIFGFTYIVCATGKSAEEMLAILKRRLDSTREAELDEAAEQQRQIMQIRLGKWLVQ
jgi:2-oxo-4-hydroxy-4-carboxy-5-ureidoimidazoline decarboxylase